MTVKELVAWLEPAVNGPLPVVVRLRLPGEEPQSFEITTVIVTLERDTAEDIVEIECGE